MTFRSRFTAWRRSLFMIVQTTIHDPWVKRFRTIAFLSASFILSQLLFRAVLDFVGLGSLLPGSPALVLIASGIWLVAYPTMWIRMVSVLAEMEANKEFEAILQALKRLHHPHGGTQTAAPSAGTTTSASRP